jgi:hypothetical protein
VYLEPVCSLSGGIAAQAALGIHQNADDVTRVTALYQALVEHNIADWTFTNGDKSKLPIDAPTVRRMLPWLDGGMEVAAKAAELYSGIVQVPFGRRQSRATSASSPPGQTDGESTSPTPSGSAKPRRRSAPSSSESSEGTGPSATTTAS